MMIHNMKKRLLGPASIALSLVLVVGCGMSGRTALPPEADNPNVVAVYADEVLTIDEFEERYARSVGGREAAVNDSLGEYKDFLERYVNFRLKVAAATEAGIAGSAEIRNEIQTYRANLARPYLLEEEVIEPIVRQLYDRRQELIDVSHILVRVEPTAAPEDTLAAYRELEAIRDSAAQGIDFAELAMRHSEDPSARGGEGRVGHGGRLGYFTAGRMVEPFETYAYLTPEGEVSPVFRTRFGYHILYVHDRMDAVPDIRLAHIMLRPRPTAEDSAATLEKLEDIRQRIEAGESFEQLAEEHSADLQSAPRGGDIGFISFDAPIHPSFKDPAFALENVGDVSDVIQTSYGYHIIKLKERREPRTFDEAYDELKELAARLPRMQEAEEELAQDVLEQQNATVDSAFVKSVLADVPADSVFTRLVMKDLPAEALDRTIVTIGDSTFTLQDISEHLATASVARTGTKNDRIRAILDGFVQDAAIDYEAAQLEARDAEFARIMEEFRDGLVLFEFMEDSVWTAAEQDSLALEEYYRAHQDEYWWPERTRVISLQSSSDSLLNALTVRLDEGASLSALVDEINADTLSRVRVDTMMIGEPTESVYDNALGLSEGEHTQPLSFRNGYILLINVGVEAARPKTFTEARTQVVSDYQVILENRLIDRLRDRFNAHTFPDRLVTAFSDEGAAQADGGVASGE